MPSVSIRRRALLCLAIFLIMFIGFFMAVAPDQRAPFYPVINLGVMP